VILCISRVEVITWSFHQVGIPTSQMLIEPSVGKADWSLILKAILLLFISIRHTKLMVEGSRVLPKLCPMKILPLPPNQIVNVVSKDRTVSLEVNLPDLPIGPGRFY